MTTLLNATVWLLAATFAAAVWGVVRGLDARAAFAAMVRVGTTIPAMIVIVGLAGAAVASRAVIGFLSPGAYAEEVVAARDFLEGRRLYRAEPQRAGEWVAEATTPLPWVALPGVTPCETESLNQRAQFYTSQAHPPMLLLGGVPIVSVAGSKGLFVLLGIVSMLAIATIAVGLARFAGVAVFSREALLVAAVIAGWQPVLAGIKQGDAVLPVTGLVVVAWWAARRQQGTASVVRTAGAALAAAMAAALAVPALGVLPALACCRRRTALPAFGLFAFTIALVVALAGWPALSAFVAIAIDTGRVYASAPTNYAIGPRIAALHVAPLLGILLVAAVAARVWIPLREPDKAFAAFVPLGLLMSPLLWSQHLALVVVPAAVLLASVLRSGSSPRLALWSALVLIISLPDGPAVSLGRLLPLTLGGNPLPAASLALIVLWLWSIVEQTARPAPAAALAPAGAAVGRT